MSKPLLNHFSAICSVIRLGNAAETPAFLELVVWLRSPQILFGATLKVVLNSRNPNISEAYNLWKIL